MSPGNKYQPYTAADILRYLQGEMTGKEMRQLELEALDDPFLQDAVDGYRLEWEKGNKEKLLLYSNEVLAETATAVQEPARVIPFYSQHIFRYAAAAVLLLGTSWMLFNLNEKTVQKEDQAQPVIVQKLTDSVPAGDVAVARKLENQATAPAMAKMKTPEYKSSESKADGNTMDDEDISPALARTAPVEPPNVEGKKTNNKEIAANSKPASQGELVAPMRSNFQTDTGRVKGVSDDSFKNIDFNKTEKASLSQAAPKTDFASPYYEEKKALSYRYSIIGKTVDKEKYPLENITLRVKGDTIATVSDELGRFQLNLRDSQATLVASGVGVETKEFLAKAKREKVEVELEPSKSQMMQEVVVSSGYAKKKAISARQELDMDTVDASPKGGWLAFTRYVERNKQVKAGKPPVYVVLSFEIDENGRPASMDIIESGGKAYDKEAIRLLKEGPAWINKTKDKITFAKITIVL